MRLIKIYLQIFLAINIFTTKSYQTAVGNNRYFASSRPTVSRALRGIDTMNEKTTYFMKGLNFSHNMQKIQVLTLYRSKILLIALIKVNKTSTFASVLEICAVLMKILWYT